MPATTPLFRYRVAIAMGLIIFQPNASWPGGYNHARQEFNPEPSRQKWRPAQGAMVSGE